MPRLYLLLVVTSAAFLAAGSAAILGFFLDVVSPELGKNAAAFAFLVSSFGILAMASISSVLLFTAGTLGCLYQECQPKGLFWNYRWPLILGTPGTGLALALITQWLLTNISSP